MKFIMANLFVAVVLGYGIIFQIKSSRDSAYTVNFVNAPVLKSVEEIRKPASVDKNKGLFPKTTAKIHDLVLDNEIPKNFECLEKEKRIKTGNESIVLIGKTCDKIKNMKITNLNNGYTASVFEVPQSKYKTDLIPLTIGVNKISVEYELDSDKKQKHEIKTQFVINREK